MTTTNGANDRTTVMIYTDGPDVYKDITASASPPGMPSGWEHVPSLPGQAPYAIQVPYAIGDFPPSYGRGDSRMTTTNGANDWVPLQTPHAHLMQVPEELRETVTWMVGMVGAGWEPCGYTGGSAGERRQFVRVEFRRRPEVSDADD